jgi:tetratricopeptide (TPR) repeat protein
MTEKKTPVSKSAEKRPAKTARPKSSTPAQGAGSDASAPAAAAPRALTSSAQIEAFQLAMRLFHVRQFSDARAKFLVAAEGPERDVAQRARAHAAMCEHRISTPAVTLRSADDYYNYAVALINSRDLSEATRHLEAALLLAPECSHIHYAMALAHALSGNLTPAYDHLRRSIELDPQNRILARRDADFAGVASQPPFDYLLYPDKKSW